MRITTFALPTALLVIGCSGEPARTQADTARDEQALRTEFRAFARAVAAGEWDAVCARLTPEGAELAENNVMGVPIGCAATLEELNDIGDGEVSRAMRGARIQGVTFELDPDRAGVHWTTEGKDDHEQVVGAERVDGRWRFAAVTPSG